MDNVFFFDFNLFDLFALSLSLFLLSIFGIINGRRSIISTLIAIELMLLAANLNFIIFSVYLDDLTGQVIALFILTVAAAESAIGLAILVAYYRLKGTVDLDSLQYLKG